MPASDKCYFCRRRVYIAERMSAEGLFFHSKCFVCSHCGVTLRRGNYEFVSETGVRASEVSRRNVRNTVFFC